jgi:diaminopropionate ammonia-lyase
MLAGDIETVMAGLSCGEPSVLAWDILEQGATDFVAVTDVQAIAAMRVMANPSGTDKAVVCGESAAAGIAALMLAQENPQLREALALNDASRVVVFGTEGDTDPALYTELVGRSAAQVRSQ